MKRVFTVLVVTLVTVMLLSCGGGGGGGAGYIPAPPANNGGTNNPPNNPNPPADPPDEEVPILDDSGIPTDYTITFYTPVLEGTADRETLSLVDGTMSLAEITQVIDAKTPSLSFEPRPGYTLHAEYHRGRLYPPRGQDPIIDSHADEELWHLNVYVKWCGSQILDFHIYPDPDDQLGVLSGHWGGYLSLQVNGQSLPAPLQDPYLCVPIDRQALRGQAEVFNELVTIMGERLFNAAEATWLAETVTSCVNKIGGSGAAYWLAISSFLRVLYGGLTQEVAQPGLVVRVTRPVPIGATAVIDAIIILPLWEKLQNLQPVAFPGGPYTGFTGQAIELQGEGLDDDDRIVSYQWDWQDDHLVASAHKRQVSSVSYAQNVYHTWWVAGTYYPTLVVTDERGLSSSPIAVEMVISDQPSSTGAIICGFQNWDDDPLTVLWSIDSMAYDRALDIPSAFSKQSDAVAVAPGQHTVYIRWFDADTGWYYTKQHTDTVVADQTTAYVFDLDEHLPAITYYTLTVDTQPVSGEIYFNGWLSGTGHAESDYPSGTDITVSFGNVSGYLTPADQNLVLNADTSRVGNYTPTGPGQCHLTVDTTPIAGEIRVNGNTAGNGHFEADYGAGAFIHLSYGDVANYITPSSEDFTMSGNTSKVGTYVYVPPPPDKWDLTVQTEPGGIGAPIDVTWQGGEQTGTDYMEVLGLIDGTHVTITFGDVTNYTKPDPIEFDIHSNATKIGTYVYNPPPPPPQYATLTIRTANFGLPVYLNGEFEGNGTGGPSSCHRMYTVQKDFLVGTTVTVHWGSVYSWTTPADQVVDSLPPEGKTITVYPDRIDTGGLGYTSFNWPTWYGSDRWVKAFFTPAIPANSGDVWVRHPSGQWHQIQGVNWYFNPDGTYYGFEFNTDGSYNSHIFDVAGDYTVDVERWVGGETVQRALHTFHWYPK